MHRLERATKVVAVALTVGLISGCAGLNERIDQAMQTAQQASSDAAAARSAAESAARDAGTARSMAESAQRAADAAKRAADQANACCAANSEKIERMFKESMRK